MMSEIIGEGRIDGWEISFQSFPSVLVSAGSGLIEKYYVNTFNDQSFELSANSKFFFYAQRRAGIIGTIGPRSDLESIVYHDAGPPASPANLSVQTPPDDPFFSVLLDWDANTEIDFDHYEIERSLSETESFVRIATNLTDTMYLDSVDEDDTYFYKVYAVDQSGFRSPESTGAATTQINPLPPSNPVSVEMPFSERAINILWKRPEATLFSKINRWEIDYVELRSDGSEETNTAQTRIVNRQLFNDRIDTLKNGQPYKVTLFTVDTKERRSTGVSQNVMPQPNPAPRDPQALAFTFSEGSSGVIVDLSWTDGTTAYEPEIPYRYNIYIKVNGENESLAINVPIGDTQETVELYTFDLFNYLPIPENTLVTFRITSLDLQGQESAGNYIKTITALFTLPLRIKNLDSEFDVNTGKITVTWVNQIDTDDILIVVLDDDINDAYTTDTIIVNDKLGKTERFIFDAELAHKYTIRVTPINTEDIEGPTSSVVELTLIAGGVNPPLLPTNLSAKPNDRRVQLRWLSSTTLATEKYRIYRHAGNISTTPSDWTVLEIVPRSINTFNDYGLENDQVYSYYITSVDIYGQESLHLPDGIINLNFIEAKPKGQGILTEPTSVVVSFEGNDISIAWESLIEEFDAFTVYRSVNNLYSWETIATIDRNIFSYVDNDVPLIDDTRFYYLVDKVINDSDIIVQSTDIKPESSIFLGSLQVGATSFDPVDITNRRDIKDMIDPLAEYTNRLLLPHRHREVEPFDPNRIDLNPELIITDWTTFDGRIFTTGEFDIFGSSYIVKINGRFPDVFFTVDPVTRRLIFSQSILTIDESTGEIVGDPPEIEVQVLGVEEVKGILDISSFDNIHARQVAFGRLNKEQLPSINHEGRIREQLLPKRYLLERHSNHHFVIPEGNDDITKNFGTGTTFYSVIESDGLIKEVVDFDLEDDESIVAFRRPSFSVDTVLNLKQSILIQTLEGANNNANEQISNGVRTWIPSPANLSMGDFNSFTGNVYLRYLVNIPKGSTVADADIIFTAHSTEPSVGAVVKLDVSILDPAGYSQEVDLETESIRLVANLNSPILYSPPIWTLGERSDKTSLDVTSLVQSFVDHSNYSEGKYIIFRILNTTQTQTDNGRVAVSFSGGQNDAPFLDISYVLDIAEVNSDPGGFQSEKSYHWRFEFEDNDPTRWVHITTFDTAIKPNPIIDLTKRLRFRMLLETGSLYVTLGVREIDLPEATIGDNGGTAGPIEWVGASDLVTNNIGNVAPLGKLVVGKVGEWQEITFDIPNEPINAYTDGNGLLGGKFATLEHLAFTINPDDQNATGPYDVYIDKIEQVSDLMVAGTSQGILLSRDFGTSWELATLTETPVHRFYRGNNGFLWAVSGSTVLFASDPAFWFTMTGTTGVQYIRDIVEDSFGNMFISTDKGVYWFEIALILTFTEWRQTQPVTAFTTDCYGMYYNNLGSGLDEIWVSTEIGIFKTVDNGEIWEDTNMKTGGLHAYQFVNISTDINLPNIITITRKHVLRKLGNKIDFEVIANFEEQHGIADLWKFSHFSGRIYISTGSGVYVNIMDNFFTASSIVVPFERVFHDLDFNGGLAVAFGLDVVNTDNGLQLFIGQENRLMVADENNVLTVKEQFSNEELPSFFLGNAEITIGYVYNAFNNVVIFREPQPVNQIVSSAHIPRKRFIPVNEGWAQTNSDTDVFIYFNGIPKWLDFQMDEPRTLSELQTTEAALQSMRAILTTFNSLFPQSQEFLDACLVDITTIRSGGEDGATLINSDTIRQFVEDFSRFQSLITSQLAIDFGVDIFPKILLAGFSSTEHAANSRAQILENKDDFQANNSTNISIDTVSGEIDFQNAFNLATDPEDKVEFTFNKYDQLQVSIFETNVTGIGEQTHRELEDRMEDINTGLSSHLTRTHYANLIKLGVFLENENNFLFDRFDVQTIQSKYYGAHTNDWYDILNSTIDYELIVKIPNISEPRFATDTVLFTEDPYFANRLWVGTDSDIIQYNFDEIEGKIVTENIVRPGNGTKPLYIWDIYIRSEDEIYVVAEDKDTQVGRIFLTANFGLSWIELDTLNLPQQIHGFTIINGTKVAITGAGVFHSDNNFGTWFPSDVVPSDAFSNDHPSLDIFRTQRSISLEIDTFLIVEVDRFFYTSGGGLEWFSVGPGPRMDNNGLRVINKVLRFKNLTWVGTDKGLYNDGNSILSDQVTFGLESELDTDAQTSATIHISDIAHGITSLYCASGDGRLYRLLDEDIDDNIPAEWKSYNVPEFNTIHKIFLRETEDKDWLIIFSYDKIKIIDVTPGSGVFE